MKYQNRQRSSVVYLLALVVIVVMLMTAIAGPLPGGGMEYTLDADFDEGVLVGVEHDTVPDQLQLSKENVTLPFIWVPNMQGTVSKINTETGDELGRYWVVPPGLPVENGSPSRTTVDLEGNCWVGNRAAGTVVKIGLYEASNWTDRNEDGICQTSQDLNGDGDITGDELLPWGEDECVLYEVVLIPGLEGTYVPGTFRCEPGSQWRPSGGRFGGALDFDGTGQHVVNEGIEAYLNGLDAVTFSLWCNSNVIGTDKGSLICTDPDGTDNRDIRYDASGASGGGTNLIKCGVTSTGGIQQLESSNNTQTTNWQHLVMTWSSGNIVKLYINGEQDTPTFTSLHTIGTLTGYTKLIVGKGGKDTGGTGWDGLIDDVAIFSRELDADDITLLNTAGGDSFIGDNSLLLLWEFDESSGFIASDSSGNGHDGTVITSCVPTEPPVWQPSGGMCSGALEFDGVDDYITHDLVLPVQKGTIAHWLQPHQIRNIIPYYEVSSETQNGFSGGSPDWPILEIHTGLNQFGQWVFWYERGGDGAGDSATVALFDGVWGDIGQGQIGVWSHVAVTWDTSGDAVLYVNGFEVAREDMTGKTFDSIAGIYHLIGAPGCVLKDLSNDRNWDGLIDDVRVYDYALTASEVVKVMNGDPVYWAAPWNPEPQDGSSGVLGNTELRWSGVDDSDLYNVYFGMSSTPPLVSSGQTETVYVPDLLLDYGTTYYWQVDRIEPDGTIHTGKLWRFTTRVRDWSNKDIGNTLPGDAEIAAGTWTITADGDDIWGNSDHFHYVYQPVTGDCEIIARVVSITPARPHGWEKAGVMIRETLDPDSKHAHELITGGSGGGESFQWRATTGGGSSHSSTNSGIAPPYWVRLVRTNNTFRGYFAPDVDGSPGQWVQEGSAVTIEMDPEVYVGLSHTSNREDSICKAVFDNVSVTGGAYLYAWAPRPSPGAENVPTDTTLSWLAGHSANEHKVYLGTSPDALELVTTTQVDEELCNLQDLDYGTTYYWRITEVADATYEGDIWDFTTLLPPGKGITREVWLGITGTSVSDLTSNPRYPDQASFSDELMSFEAPIDWANNYGTRIHGYLHPQTDGDYTFWIASDDASELRLSTDDDPANAVLIAAVPGWTSSRQWNKYPEQQSASIPLVGGQKYYVMALYKEGTGGDNLAVAWQGPDCTMRDVISGYYLSPYGSSSPPKTPGLAAHWKLDETEGTTASDSCGNGHDGMLIGHYDLILYDTDKWSTSPRGLAVDAENNLWAGTYVSSKYYHIDGATGSILKTVDVSAKDHHAYGAVIDKNGILWSAGHTPANLLRMDPSTDPPTISTVPIDHEHVYGLGLDYLDHLFVSAWSYYKLSRVDILTATVDWTQFPKYELEEARGVACTSDNNVWVACTGPGYVCRYDNDGIWQATINVGSPTGVAVDAAGKVWVCNLNDGYIKRIDPATNEVDLSKYIIFSGGHYSYSDMTGIISRTITTRIGTWTVIYDSGFEDTTWGIVSWNSDEPEGTSISFKVRSSNDQSTWSLPEAAGNALPLSSTPGGRYLEIKATLQIVTGEVSPILYDLTVNARPVADAGPDQTVECACNTSEGTKVTLDGTGSYDADGDPLTYTWTGPFDESPVSGCNPTVTLTGGCPDDYEITLVVSDGVQDSDPDAVVITVVDTTPPVISNVDADYLLATIYQTVTFSAVVLDDCDADVVVEWNFGDGTEPSSISTHAYEQAGIYTVTITATDDCANTATDNIIVVVYDPTAGFTTGGGWFVPDSDSFIDGVGVTDTVSKANFGFIVRYKKGADNPDGNLEFQYKAGDINLHSLDMEWMVVQSETKVRFKGLATINGEGLYTFKVTAEDNGEPGTGDWFKIEIWMGRDVDTENNPPTPKHKAQGFLGGGNIQIHQ